MKFLIKLLFLSFVVCPWLTLRANTAYVNRTGQDIQILANGPFFSDISGIIKSGEKATFDPVFPLENVKSWIIYKYDGTPRGVYLFSIPKLTRCLKLSGDNATVVLTNFDVQTLLSNSNFVQDFKKEINKAAGKDVATLLSNPSFVHDLQQELNKRTSDVGFGGFDGFISFMKQCYATNSNKPDVDNYCAQRAFGSNFNWIIESLEALEPKYTVDVGFGGFDGFINFMQQCYSTNPSMPDVDNYCAQRAFGANSFLITKALNALTSSPYTYAKYNYSVIGQNGQHYCPGDLCTYNSEYPIVVALPKNNTCGYMGNNCPSSLNNYNLQYCDSTAI